MGLSSVENLEHLLFLSMAFVIHLFVNSDPGTIQRACPQLGGTLTSLFCATETFWQPDSPRSPGLPLCVVWRYATEQSVGGGNNTSVPLVPKPEHFGCSSWNHCGMGFYTRTLGRRRLEREADRIRMNNVTVLSSRTQPVLTFNKSEVRTKFSKH